MTLVIIIIAAGVFVASIVALVATIVVPDSSNTVSEDRLSQMASRRRLRGQAEDSDSNSLVLDDHVDSASMFNGLAEKMPALGTYMAQGQVNMPPTQFLLICMVAGGVGAALCLVTPFKLLALLIGPVFAVMPFGYLAFKRKRRLTKFGNQMPEALELLGRSLKAGHSLNAGFGLIGKELNDPLATEFGRVFEEQNLGVPLDEAIEEMANRVPNMDLRFFATAVILQRQTGGDLSEILDKIGRLIRERQQLYGQIQALTGEGRMSGAVLLAMPPVLFLVMLKLNYDYVATLFTDPLGTWLLGFGLITQVLGAIMIKKIIDIKV
ncbi:Bacterial type II secretion system protein F domain protein [Stieleria bergensis]|uniref:Bacterial type II secretion system protein F domain protein n=1 Tax=Stieleria bergensis TaxID=2528025 RepID=A0A517SZQ2_9BACT|nr:Bacterial type II secretion system protein F domain protein [Planctomycetes bacterium SV_7m_r]